MWGLPSNYTCLMDQEYICSPLKKTEKNSQCQFFFYNSLMRHKIIHLTFFSLFWSSSRSALQSVRDAISNQVAAVLQLYEQNTDSMDLRTVTERSPSAPSVADMLGWLQDAERHYRQQYPFFPGFPGLGVYVCVLCSRPFFTLNCYVQIPEEEDSVSDPESRWPLTSGVCSPKMEIFGVSQYRGPHHR